MQRQHLLFLAFIAPNFLLLGIFTYWPMIYQGYLSLTRRNMLMQSYFRENPNFKVAVDQLPRTQP